MPHKHINEKMVVWDGSNGQCEGCLAFLDKLTLVRVSIDKGLDWGVPKWVCNECLDNTVHRYETITERDGRDILWVNTRYVEVINAI